MKKRLSAVAAVISSISILTACGSGGPGSFTTDAPAPTPAPPPTPVAPTVTVTAPATATAGFAFNIAWSSTDATSCSSSDLTGVSDANGSVSQTETAVATKTYSVTCTGAGGDATGTATVAVAATPTAEGAWQGTATVGSGRNVSGVVTKEGDYWLAYAPSSTIVGFYAGTGASTATTETSGTYTSANLREINFAGGFSGGGNAAAGTLDSGAFTAKTSFSGTLTPVAGGTATGAIFDNITTIGTIKLGTTVVTNEAGTSVGSTTLNGNTLTIRMSTLLSIAPPNGTDSATIVSDETFTGTLSGGVFTPTAAGAGAVLGQATIISCTPVSTATPPNQICSGTQAGDVQAFINQGGSVSLTSGGTLFTRKTPTAGSITLNRRTDYTVPAPTSQILSSLSPITAGTFNLPTYDSTYESTPTLTALGGSYTGSAGVGVAEIGATLNIDATSGAITGTAGTCTLGGNAVVHPTGGNVYDVTLNFTGGSCAYTSKGQFAGVATYNATTHQVTVMALDSGKDTGFLFVGTKP